MLIRKKRWLLVTVLFVMAPMAGLVFGVFGGLHLMDKVTDEVDVHSEMAVESSETDTQQAAADATLTLPHGADVSIDELAPERRVVMVVMKDVDCPVCQRQLRVLSEKLNELERQGATVVGLSDAGECANQRLMNRLGLNFPVVSDVDHEFLEALDMTLPDRRHVMPGLVLVGEDGQIEHIHQGRTPGQQQERLIMRWLR